MPLSPNSHRSQPTVPILTALMITAEDVPEGRCVPMVFALLLAHRVVRGIAETMAVADLAERAVLTKSVRQATVFLAAQRRVQY